MYLLDHLNKMSKLLVHGLLAIPCGKRQVAGVDDILGVVSSSCSFSIVEASASWPYFAFPAEWVEFDGSRVVLPPLVVTTFTFSQEFLG